MLHGLVQWCTGPSATPQSTFQRLHDRLACPPSGRTSSPAGTSALPHARVLDPYHFIVCQHGVLGSAGDFEHVITDLFVHHEVSVLEAVEAAESAAAAVQAPCPSSAPAPPLAQASVLTTAASLEAPCALGNATTSPSESPTASESTTASATPAPPTYASQATACDARQEAPLATAAMKAAAAAAAAAAAQAAPGCSTLPTLAGTSADAVDMESMLTPQQRARRASYKAGYALYTEYPNRTKGRLYRSGNLQCFAPGCNEYLRTDAGTQGCARKMLAEVVPALHAWLNEVESRERQRAAKWAVYTQTAGHSAEATRTAAEASAPLPVCLSLMAHSFGGILHREFLYLLLLDKAETRGSDAVLFDSIVSLRRRLQRLHVTFENYITVATPHCGAGECLWWPIYFGAWCLARLNLCQTYDELIMADANRVLQKRLIDAPHLRVLELFRRRVLFANTHRDLVVGFGTCSLIFENVDTDHTKFIGVAPGDAHCAAAFANNAVEVSRPILLRSFTELSAATRRGEGSDAGRCWCREAARVKTHTVEDIFFSASSAPAGAAWGASSSPPLPLLMSDERATAVCDAGTERWHPACALNASTSTAGLTASSTSSPSSPMTGAFGSPRAPPTGTMAGLPTPLLVGRTVPALQESPVYVEDVAVPWAGEHSDHGDEELDVDGDAASSVSSTAPSNADTTVAGSARSCAVSVWSRPLSVLRRGRGLLRGASPLLLPPQGRTDIESVASSRRSGASSGAVVSLLRDPRWTAERVRSAAATVHAEVQRRLWTPTATAISGDAATSFASVGGDCCSGDVAATDAFVSPVEAVATPLTMLPRTDAPVPQYRQTPRAIAAALRQRLSWRVRAIRLDNVLPAGHVACLGNWGFCGRSPSVVQAVAEEMLVIL